MSVACGAARKACGKALSIKAFAHRPLIMNRHNLTAVTFLACMSLLFIGLASADVARCVDEDGSVTYTNLPCVMGSHDTANYPDDSTLPVESGIVSAPDIADADSNHQSAWVKFPARTRSVMLDAETIKAAKSSMLAMDQASHFAQRRNVIALDQRNGKWFDFQ
jgi:hypothetical protein